MYCGNNALFPGLTTGTHFIGTNYQCLKKGRNFKKRERKVPRVR